MTNPQKWNRYDYVQSNPLRYTDPTGHDGETFLVAVVVALVVFAYDATRRHAANATECNGTLSDCFQRKSLKQFTENQNIDQKEFDGMLDSIHDDLKRKWLRTPLDPARTDYDTPFFDGNPRFGAKTKTDHVVCISGECAHQSAVNYVAQGMYSARTHEPLFVAKLMADAWNLLSYGHRATNEEKYWIEKGYGAYKDREMQPTGTSGTIRQKLLHHIE